MADIILQAIDIERAAIKFLGDALPSSVRVSRSAPDVITEPTVTLRRTGGTQLNPGADQARLDIIVYAPTDAEANALSLQVQAHLSSWRGGGVRRVDVSGPADIGGRDEKPRRHMYADLRLRRVAIPA